MCTWLLACPSYMHISSESPAVVYFSGFIKPYTLIFCSILSADHSRLHSFCLSRVHLKPGALCTQSSHLLSVCDCVYADSVWSFTTQTAAQSPCLLWCMRPWLIEHKRGGRLYGEFRNDSANVIDDPVGFFFMLIFFKGNVDGLHLIKPSHLQQGPLC